MGLQNYQAGVNGSCAPSFLNSCNTSNCNACPDFTIKRHDTRPAIKVLVEECDPTIDWTDAQLVVEANIWFNAKLKAAVTSDDDEFKLADNVGFDQMLPDDLIVMGGPRSTEMMLVTGFDEANKTVQVQRAYHGTTARAWVKGTKMRVFRAMNAPAAIDNVFEDVLQEDGTTATDQLTGSYLVYEWQPSDTCLPGCFMLEFKLMRMLTAVGVEDTNPYELPDGIVIPDGVTLPSEVTTPSEVAAEYGCVNGLGVEWVRRFPVDKEAFLVQVFDSPTAET